MNERNEIPTVQTEPPESGRPARTKYERLPLACIVIFAIGIICLLLWILQRAFPSFSDFFNQYVSSPVRIALSFLTAWIPFSVAECVLLCSPVIFFLVLRHAIHKRTDTWRSVIVFVAILLAVAILIGSLFVLGFSAGYSGTPLEDKLELNTADIRQAELIETAYYLALHLNHLSQEIEYGSNGFSDMPYSLSDMNARLIDSYGTLHEQYVFVSDFPSTVKPVLISEGLSYMHITGLYSFFTGEANLNVASPDFLIPYTAAHELAHQRGIAREDEANFIAFQACMAADDPYIAYSGYLNMFFYVGSAVHDADAHAYQRIYQTLSHTVQKEIAAYGAFYQQYAHSVAADVSETVNNAYLQSQGTPGTVSYNFVVRLMVGYYRQLRNTLL